MPATVQATRRHLVHVHDGSTAQFDLGGFLPGLVMDLLAGLAELITRTQHRCRGSPASTSRRSARWLAARGPGSPDARPTCAGPT